MDTPQKLYILKRGEPTGLCARTYSGTPYKVRFRPTSDILLHGIGYAGVYRWSARTKFFAELSIKESLNHDNQKKLSKPYATFIRRSLFMKEEERGKKFTIRFQTPVALLEDVLVDLSFQFDPAFADKRVRFDTIGDESGGIVKHTESG